MDYLVIIPARFQSTRFPGKPLVDIFGKSMIHRVWEKCVEATSHDKVLVATDDQRIIEHCKNNNMEVLLTSNNCLTGTDRLYEVAQKRKTQLYINVQGDEPLISPETSKLPLPVIFPDVTNVDKLASEPETITFFQFGI